MKEEGWQTAATQHEVAACSSTTPSPASATSSPSHEFSFTISLHSSSAPPPLPDATNNNTKSKPTTPPPNSSSSAIDLSPADDIFFHGHLLPLHLLSHLPAVSPRSSTNSMDSFTLPIKDLPDDHSSTRSTSNQKSNSANNIRTKPPTEDHDEVMETRDHPKGRPKSKSFSLFGWRKRCEAAREREDVKEKQQKKRLKFDHVSHMVKRYARMVRAPLLYFGGRNKENPHFQRQQPHSFSGHLSVKSSKSLSELRVGRRRGEFSAPASMRTSPSNSGLLCTIPNSPTSDSTMEELQAAIQAAIAHCKNSISAEDKIKC